MPLLQRKKVIKFIPCINYAEINDHVSALVCSLVKKNKNTVLGFSVGITMEDLYNKIITKAHKQKISFKNTITFNTDEYLETHKHHQKHTKTSFMKEHLFSKLDIKLENTNFPTSKNYKTYDKKIKALGGIDLLILTIGVNGYVGANEPDTKFHSWTHIQKLSETTKNNLMTLFDEKINVPNQVITMGIQSILQAKKIVLIAVGESKAAAVNKLFKNKYNPLWPVTTLIYHDDVTLYADTKACKLIQK